MENNIGEILFTYLNNILYSPEKAELDTSLLPEEFSKLGEELKHLDKCLKEQREFTEVMFKGHDSQYEVSADNPLVVPFKEIQNVFKHITWQTQQVSKGDYSQKLDIKGEFGDAFNAMIKQLDERSKELEEERKLVEQKKIEMRRTVQLMQILANDTNNLIYVYELETGAQVFANNTAKKLANMEPFVSLMIQNDLMERSTSCDIGSTHWELEINPGRGAEKLFYDVESFCATQEDGIIVVHILVDDTERKKYENLTATDPLTGLHNKVYAIHVMEKYMEKQLPFCIAFVDVDYLKYCNDTFGHDGGDSYLMRVTDMLKRVTPDVCRIGGDEFLMVIKGKEEQQIVKQLFNLRTELETTGLEAYPKSFSFGISSIPVNPSLPLKNYIKQADEYMYKFKQVYKKPLMDLTYKDDRK